ncbi:uncharacterized protein MYCFIDRAFT_179002 [Pseudocercospora fijiensis CIRAD86]|uniref:Uncharacterized protein n=1 Tax=Pseudocercospora fijiensis (strain CIRAD86) TaxID=383855 RepID=M2ZIH5_PSEFD|nr:uncharacterized protein MYCFIDRAFT_179002 [Pseudocercospora fijiensis CIRAD86]EME78919.1 hypothetical protein MYCFIDRAFT_179002 [Pseudocercospora fijiensis CIRAD86]
MTLGLDHVGFHEMQEVEMIKIDILRTMLHLHHQRGPFNFEEFQSNIRGASVKDPIHCTHNNKHNTTSARVRPNGHQEAAKTLCSRLHRSPLASLKRTYTSKPPGRGSTRYDMRPCLQDMFIASRSLYSTIQLNDSSTSLRLLSQAACLWTCKLSNHADKLRDCKASDPETRYSYICIKEAALSAMLFAMRVGGGKYPANIPDHNAPGFINEDQKQRFEETAKGDALLDENEEGKGHEMSFRGKPNQHVTGELSIQRARAAFYSSQCASTIRKSSLRSLWERG